MSENGQKITFDNGQLNVPHEPIIPFIEGDGIGPDIWAASVRVFDVAVEKSYDGQRSISWKEIPAGEKANEETGEWLPQESVDTISDHLVAIKGPLTTPVRLCASGEMDPWSTVSREESGKAGYCHLPGEY